MRNDLISIIMCVYNEKIEYIKESIESIINQTYTDIELIIVCDNPKNINIKNLIFNYASKDERIKIIVNKENMGLCLSLNKAILIIKGKYIARMDADDISMLDRLECQKKYLLKNNLDIIGSGVVCIDEEGKIINTLNKYPLDNKTFMKKILYNNCMAHPTWFGRRDVFIKNNGYRNIDYAEDYDFILRGLKLGYKMGNINKILLKYRIRENSISKSNGLNQYITFYKLLSFYKNDQLDDIDEIKNSIKEASENLDKQQYEKYQKASNYFLIASKKIYNKKLSGFFYLFKAMCESKFYRRKIYSYFKGIM